MTDFDEKFEQVLGHAAAHLIIADDDTADAIRRFLHDELKENPSLGDDPERVDVLIRRVTGAITKAESRQLQPADELRGL